MSNKRLKRCYFIQDNGSIPFKVCDYSNKTISVFVNQVEMGLSNKIEVNQDITNDNETTKWKFWKTFDYLKIFVPKNADKSLIGNTILVNTSNENNYEYVFIHRQVIKFSLKIPIIKFFSPVLEYDVIHPYSVTDESVIILDSERKDKAKKDMDIDEMITSNKTRDPYEEYNNLISNEKNNLFGRNIIRRQILHANPRLIYREILYRENSAGKSETRRRKQPDTFKGVNYKITSRSIGRKAKKTTSRSVGKKMKKTTSRSVGRKAKKTIYRSIRKKVKRSTSRSKK